MHFVAAIFTIIRLAAAFTTISPIAIMVAEVYAKFDSSKHNLIGSGSILLALMLSFFASISQILST